MAHYVICKICGKRFDRDTEQGVKCGNRRYAHYECYPEGEKVPLLIKNTEDEDLKKLKAYISKIYGKDVNWALVMKQIKEYQKEYNYSLSGILKSLVWFYEVKGNSVEKSKNGIGIVRFVYQEAFNYYYNLFLIKEQNKNVNVHSITKTKEIEINLPKVIKHKRLFKFLDEDV